MSVTNIEDAVAYENLVIKDGEVGHMLIPGGQGDLKRGLILTNTGLAMQSKADNYACYVLAENVSTGAAPGDDDPDPDPVVAQVYKTGTFNKAALTAVEGYTITDADYLSLRDYGILVEDVF